MAGPPLFLHEEILLLALRDREGTVERGALDAWAMAGAVLAELLLGGRIAVDTGPRRKRLVRLVRWRPVGDPVIDSCLAMIRDAKRRATLESWLARLARLKDLRHRVASQLCHRGILRAEEVRVFRLFKRRVYPERDHGPEQDVIDRLRRAIVDDGRDVEPRTTILVSLARAAELLDPVLGPERVEGYAHRLDRIVRGEATREATREALTAARTATLLSLALPVLGSSTVGAGS